MRRKISARNLKLVNFSDDAIHYVEECAPEFMEAATYAYCNNVLELLRLNALSKGKYARHLRKALKRRCAISIKDKKVSHKKKLQILFGTYGWKLFDMTVYYHDIVMKKK